MISRCELSKKSDEARQRVRPLGGIVNPNNFGHHQGVVQGKALLSLLDGPLEQAGPYQVLLVFLYAILDVGVEPPVSVDAVLQLNDGEEADIE